MSGMFTESRSLTKVKTQTQYYTSNGATVRRVLTFPGIQTTTSYRSGSRVDSEQAELERDSNIWVPTDRMPIQGDTGHEFSTFKGELTDVSRLSGVRCVNRNGTVSYLSGPIGPGGFYGGYDVGYPTISPLDANGIKLYGSRALNATYPTKPGANLATMLGELKRDGVPALIGSDFLRHRTRSALAGEYLNIEFGWKPLVSDLQALLRTVVNSTAILEQFRRDSGRIVRRRFSFPAESSTVGSVSFPGSNYYGVVDDSGSARDYSYTDTVNTRIWYSGAYSYYLDVGDNLISKARMYEQMANRLLGTRLTPDVLWELTPWSWLVDWFATVGQSLSNASALSVDGLVIRYGYLMRHTVSVRTVHGAYKFSQLADPVSVSSSYRSERKERYRSTPFGFGLTVAGFTPRQWAILGALGMTRAPRVAY